MMFTIHKDEDNIGHFIVVNDNVNLIYFQNHEQNMAAIVKSKICDPTSDLTSLKKTKQISLCT